MGSFPSPIARYKIMNQVIGLFSIRDNNHWYNAGDRDKKIRTKDEKEKQKKKKKITIAVHKIHLRVKIIL